MMLQLGGFHHLTAVTARARENVRLYTKVLGLRLVKKTVNQDDVSAYHLFYGDGVASPGSDITFFDWPAPREQRGNRTVTRTGFRVTGAETLEWWREQLRAEGLPALSEITTWHGWRALLFEDPEGQRLALVDDEGQGEGVPWERSPVPADRQIRGLGPMEITIPQIERTERVLTEVLGMRLRDRTTNPDAPDFPVYSYEMGPGGPSATLHVAVRPDLRTAQPGAGGVHHVAFRVPDEEQYHAWERRLRSMGVQTSGEVDRFYFRSIYFREPGGVLFELATDGPGFDADEPMESLGERLALPPFLEPHREQIEAGLQPLD